MKVVKFIKEPGFMYDLFFLFILNFNKDYCLSNYINYSKSNEDMAYYNKILSDFDPISDDLLPFFYMKENKKCFITEFAFDKYESDFLTSYNLSVVQKRISSHKEVISDVAKYYFPDVDEKALEDNQCSIQYISTFIKSSNYTDTVKSSLYSFFINPIPAIQQLSYELMAKEFQLSQQYEKNYLKIVEMQEQVDIDIDDILGKINQHKNYKIDIEQYDTIYISVCFYAKNCIRNILFKNNILFFLGSDYKEMLQALISQNLMPDLDVFGNAIAEKNRMEILELIFKKEEISIRDIEQELKFTGTNAYYHLSLMIKAGMIKSRNQGRTVLYSINKSYFEIIIKMLSKYLYE